MNKIVTNKWNAILAVIFILNAGCVRIDVPEIVFVKPKTYVTKKECRVFHEILKGKTNAQITETLNISNHSIECYVSRIYDITGIRNREQLINHFCS